MKVDESGWNWMRWLKMDGSGWKWTRKFRNYSQVLFPPPPPLLLLLITPFDWRRQNIGYHEFLQNLGGGGPRTDFTLCANRNKWKKNYWKLPKPLILSRGPSVPDQKDSVILAKIKKNFQTFFFFNSKACFGVPESYWNTPTK